MSRLSEQLQYRALPVLRHERLLAIILEGYEKWSKDHEGYADDNEATCKVTLTLQAECEDTEKEVILKRISRVVQN